PWMPGLAKQGLRLLADQLPAPRYQQPQLPALPLGKLFGLHAQRRFELIERPPRARRFELAPAHIEERREFAAQLVDHRKGHAMIRRRADAVPTPRPDA